MKLAATILCSSLVSCAAVQSPSGSSSATESTEARARMSKVSAYFGLRQFDDDFEPLEDQGTIGVGYSMEPPKWPVGWEAGFFVTAADDEVGGFDVESVTSEFYGGVRKSFGEGVARPYVGAGLSLLFAAFDAEGPVDEDDDIGIGAYAHGGVDFQISPLFSLGFDVRGLFGTELEIYGSDLDANYWQYALVAGFSF